MESTTSIPIPTEVVAMILSNLGKKDLLNCRLVCDSWNKECLKHLRKSNFTMSLDLNRTKAYVRFANRQSNPQLVLPFHIDFDIPLYPESVQNFKKFAKNLKLLIDLFGPECVVSMGLSLSVYIYSIENDGGKTLILFTELLCIISSGLKVLDLIYLRFNPSDGAFYISAVEILKQRQIKFWNLKKLKLSTEDSSLWDYAPIVQYIFENSSNLQTLKLSHGCFAFISSIPISFEKLKILDFGNIHAPSVLLARIYERQSSSVLQKLKLGLPTDMGTQTKIYRDILNYFSETINSLTITLYGNRPGKGLIISFPKFSNLKYLKLKSKYMGGYPIYQNPHDINFNLDTFPVLKTISIPIGFFLMSNATNYIGNPIFPDIKNLILNVHDTNESGLKGDSMYLLFEENLEHIQSIFPNAVNVVIVDKCEKEKHQVKQVIQELIHSTKASIIQNITFRNCDQDYLGQVLNQMSYKPRIILENLERNPKLEQIIKDAFQNWTGSSDSDVNVISIRGNELNGINIENKILSFEEKTRTIDHNMTNIHTIKFEQSPLKYGNKNVVQLGSMKLNEFTLIKKYFPNLRQIGISSIKFDQNQQIYSNEIQTIRTQFPNITINII